jgi:hypothetical protein
MALPVKPLATKTLEINGETVEYRSLSRSEALKLNEFRGREDEAEVFVLMASTGCSEAEAKAFRDSNDTATAGLLIDGIFILSGLVQDDENPN